MRDDVLTLPDGRTVSYTDCGRPDGPAAVYFHGTGSCRLDQVHLDELLSEIGVRLVAPDRPGIGESSLRRGRSLADSARDTADVAAALGIEAFAVVGVSAGGPHAIACAALLPERVVGLGCVGGLTSPAWDGYWARVSPEAASILRRGDEQAYVEHFAALYGVDGSGFPFGAEGLSPPDAALFDRPKTVERLRRGVDESIRRGVGGLAQDAVVRAQPWAFDPAGIGVDTQLYHGVQDVVVEIASSEYTASLIDRATVVAFPQHGHLSVWDEIPTLLDDLTQPLR